MALSHINGIAVANISHINSVAKSSISAINGITAGFGGGGGITYVGAGAWQASTSAITLPLPSGTQESDILVALFHTSSGDAITLAGYSEAGNSPQNNGDWGVQLTVFWKRAGGSESAPTSSDSGGMNQGCLLGFRGCVATGNPFDATSGSILGGGGSTSVTIPGVTTTVPNAMVIAAVNFYRNVTASGSNIGSGANANLDDFNERVDECVNNLTGNAGGIGAFTGIKATAGATGNSTATLSASSGHGYWTGALIPA